jgi:hypothetical protein
MEKERKFSNLRYYVGSSRAYGEEERGVQGFGGETWGKETTGETQA